jgi:2,4-dienoyl-CoA reductase-like NADH-dependent reductase (Old Yellow Enzyme family)
VIDPFAATSLGPVPVRNRFVKAATFEGLGNGREVGHDLIAFHRAVAEGGVGVSTLAFSAVSSDGRGAPRELVVGTESVDGLQRFATAIRDAGAEPSIQLGHAGPVAAAAGARAGMAPSRVFAPQAVRFTRAATEPDIERVIGDFAAAASIAVDAGLRILELHFGHGYLVSSSARS